jgi:hypothetical protein
MCQFLILAVAVGRCARANILVNPFHCYCWRHLNSELKFLFSNLQYSVFQYRYSIFQIKEWTQFTYLLEVLRRDVPYVIVSEFRMSLSES